MESFHSSHGSSPEGQSNMSKMIDIAAIRHPLKIVSIVK